MEALRKPAQAFLDAGFEYWRAYQREIQPITGAVVWIKDANGAMVIFTRGEYRDVLMKNIDTEIYGEDKPALAFPGVVSYADLEAEVARYRDVATELVAFQVKYEKNTMGEKMPGNPYYSGMLMLIVDAARKALEGK